MLTIALVAQLVATVPASLPTCGPSLAYGTVCVWRAPVYVVHGTVQRPDLPAATPGPEMRAAVLWELPAGVDPPQEFHLSLEVAVGDGAQCSPSNRFVLVVDKGQNCR